MQQKKAASIQQAWAKPKGYADQTRTHKSFTSMKSWKSNPRIWEGRPKMAWAWGSGGLLGWVNTADLPWGAGEAVVPGDHILAELYQIS